MTTTTENIRTWATSNAGNAAADAGIASSDSTFPDTMDNIDRAIMTAVRRESDDRGGAIVAGGTATALTVTTASGIASAHVTDGFALKVRTASAATGAATIAVDALGAAAIKRADGAAIAAGDWLSGQVLDLVYSTTATAYLATNIGAVAINGLTTDNSPDLAADFIPYYDTSEAVPNKALPKNFFPSKQASFRASKSASQAMTGSETTVTWDTEQYDIGAAFASNAWTPPAGKVAIGGVIKFTGVNSGKYTIVRVKKDGAAFAEFQQTTNDSAVDYAVSFQTVDDAGGANAYTVTVESDDSAFSAVGAQTYYSHFYGYMI